MKDITTTPGELSKQADGPRQERSKLTPANAATFLRCCIRMTRVSFLMEDCEEGDGKLRQLGSYVQQSKWRLTGVLGSLCLLIGLILLVVNLRQAVTVSFITSGILIGIGVLCLLLCCCLHDEFRPEDSHLSSDAAFAGSRLSRLPIMEPGRAIGIATLYIRDGASSLPCSAMHSPMAITSPFLTVPHFEFPAKQSPKGNSVGITSPVHQSPLPIVSS